MTWTLHQDLVVSYQIDTRTQIVINATRTTAYFTASNRIFSYDGVSITDITGTTFSDLNGGSGGTPAGICMHNNTLYCLITGAGVTDTGLYSYDGMGTAWTLETQHLDDADLFPMGYEAYDRFELSPIATDGTNFVVVSTGSGGAHNRLWSSTDPASPVRVDLEGDYDNPYSMLVGLFEGINTVFGHDNDSDKCMTITDVATLETPAPTDPLIFAVSDNLQFFSIALGGVPGYAWELGYSDDWGATINGCGAPYRTVGFPKYWRFFKDTDNNVWLGGAFGAGGGGQGIFLWNGSGFDLDYDLSGGGAPYGFFILGNYVYCLAAVGAVDAKFYRTPLVLTSNELRYLGMAADAAKLYVTAGDGTNLKLYMFDLATLTLDYNAPTFGGASFAELDNRTRGIFPVVRPGTDGVLFLRGRDGNEVQVQASIDYGESFADIDDGGWGSSKYAAALLPDPLRPDDMVVAFDDDDIYRSQDGGDSWTKAADAPVLLRAAARHLIDEADLILAGQGAGSGELFFSPNYGVTNEDISDGAMATVNAIEVSR